MKRFLSFMAAAVFALLTVGCAEGYDDSALWNKIREMDSRLVNLEELCKEMNTNISSLQTIVEALQNNDYVTAIVPIKKEGEVIGYTISFAKSDSITLYINGGENQEGYVPQIGVKEDVDGQIYWTIDGEWLLDDEGNKVKAVGQDGKDGQDGQPGADGEDGQDGQPGADGEDGQDGQPGADGQDGQDGKDGVTPELKIENGMWYVSYDGGESWTELGKATGEDGKDGQNGQDGKPGADGEDGVGVIVDVSWDEENVYFTLYDGTVITLPFSGAATPEEPEEPTTLVKATVQEFLNAAEDETIYELTGEITGTYNTTYGNFYLKDSTGEVLIYGLLTPEGESQKQYTAAGLKDGDIITLQTVRTSYNGTPQGKNAIYVSHTPAQGGGNEEPEQPVEPTPTPGEGGYTKVTSVADLTDGEYLIVYDANSPAYVFNGQDAVNGYEEAAVSGNSISGTFAGVVMIETMEGGYSIKASAGYLSGTKDSNKLNFGSTAALNTITFEADGTALITSNTSVLRFNSTSNQMRFRYYKSTSYTAQQPVSLYKKN